ncbi:GlsB/YeaQ/YmgE family stress response membrane protein [Streptomyces smyrnaeus]|uniref:GlsB/YeaQ/YmgE family stress response membrane protein n=1 Tax=Streptomyces smyrnaeus TaxID=1387713 RepID=A0ABS3XXG5_9ACTN|nr:GlsB/YeaQ/YmgE family stress response membrane protein [Streptomyces smyrnaeus]MBO8200026.1 GlsB/YeaQ/YmgE family stress response membrane protein [Streptomyces smyrnaeus]
MDISGLISALVVGIVIGALGRLVLPGRQQVGVVWTIVVGIVAALIGSGIAGAVGVADTKGFDWIELIIQVALAAVGVGALERARAGGRVRR